MEIKFFTVGCGDAISIRFLGNDAKYHNILIDGGTEFGDLYTNALKRKLQEIVDKEEIIDLWIITHIDDDHIGGILRFIKDEQIREQVDLTKTKFWFNYSNFDYDTGLKDNNLISVSQGIRLRDFLAQHSKIEDAITSKCSQIDFWGAKISILSPDNKKFNELVKKRENKKIKIRERKSIGLTSSQSNDYERKLEDFDLSKFKEDSSDENGVSIAFLFEHKGKKILFLSDSHPSVIVKSLIKLGYSKGKKIVVDYMQIAHHGSKRNTNDKLLQMIDCENFIISADGYNKHNLPNKETLARILKNYPCSRTKFFITHKNNLTDSIFDVDESVNNISFEFPESGANAIVINF